MRYEIEHSEFKGKKLAVRSAGWFSGSQVSVDGVSIKERKGAYPVIGDSGAETLVQLRSRFLDPVPKVVIGEEIIELESPLKWYEYLWIGIPILLIIAGGAFGALCGVMATIVSGKIFRGQRGTFAKYGLSALSSLAAAAVYLVFAIIIHLVFNDN